MILSSEPFDRQDPLNSPFGELVLAHQKLKGANAIEELKDLTAKVKACEPADILLQRDLNLFTGIPAFLNILGENYSLSQDAEILKVLNECVNLLRFKDVLNSFDSLGALNGHGALLYVLLKLKALTGNKISLLRSLTEITARRLIVRSQLVLSEKIQFLNYDSFDFSGLNGYSGLAGLFISLGNFCKNGYLVDLGKALIKKEDKIFRHEGFTKIVSSNGVMDIAPTTNTSWYDGTLGMLLARLRHSNLLDDPDIISELLVYTKQNLGNAPSPSETSAIHLIKLYVKEPNLNISQKVQGELQSFTVESEESSITCQYTQEATLKENILFPVDISIKDARGALPQKLYIWYKKATDFLALNVTYPKTSALVKQNQKKLKLPFRAKTEAELSSYVNSDILDDREITNKIKNRFLDEEKVNKFYESLPRLKNLFVELANIHKKRLQLIQSDNSALLQAQLRRSKFIKIIKNQEDEEAEKLILVRFRVLGQVKFDIRTCHDYEAFLFELSDDFSPLQIIDEANEGKSLQHVQENVIFIIRRLLLDRLIDPVI